MATSRTKHDRDNPLAKFEVKNLQGLTTDQQLDAGAFGAVYKVTVDGVPRIAKRLRDSIVLMEGATVRKRFEDECLLLSSLDHPNIVEFIGVHYADQAHIVLCLIMERLYMNLEQYMKSKTYLNIPLSVKVSILCDVAAGLLYLHSQYPPIMHCDLTADNILLTKDLQAKIADFGAAKRLPDVNSNKFITFKQCPGARGSMPPEALRENPVYGTKLDVFSFGQLTLHVALQKFPMVYDASSDPEFEAASKKGEVQLLKRSKWISMLPRDHCFLVIIKSCLQDSPENRPHTKDLKAAMKLSQVQCTSEDVNAESGNPVTTQPEMPAINENTGGEDELDFRSLHYN